MRRGPILGIARYAPPRGFLHVLVDDARNHVDYPAVAKGFNSLLYPCCLFVSQARMRDEKGNPAAQLVPGFTPLIFGHNDP